MSASLILHLTALYAKTGGKHVFFLSGLVMFAVFNFDTSDKKKTSAGTDKTCSNMLQAQTQKALLDKLWVE